ncbi:hypothetical protein [Polyangium mundeleinium]|uniref:Tryptophan synthase alpha chain n=1 Tax=Polyangium mundeleinium TaxID=2995306 RepID=A0ABT5EJ42_9BACT|nr:hypothetical protein [Polyangium mundeleinium]MDC0741198.1 hypothetical protein [Polyangium mundeleinium]
MKRSAILTATLLSALGLTYLGCTQDFNQFEPSGGTGGLGGGTSSSSTGGTGGVGGVGGMGGGGMGGGGTGGMGGMPCQNPGDCPADTTCRDWSCVNGTCEADDAPDGMNLPDPMNGDCKALECDGMGGEKVVNDDDDTPPGDGNPCTTSVCVSGLPMQMSDPSGDPCPDGVCNGSGACVECVEDNHCSGNDVCSGNTCVECATDADCTDGVCNGGTCVACVADNDCMGTNPTCLPDNTCISCSDGVKNGDETGIDCGGAKCAKCDAAACAANAECESNFCVDGVCCATACTGTCQACNVMGNVGTCSPVPVNQDDTNGMTPCMGNKACDGAGVCKGEPGAPCTNNPDCLNNMCTGSGANKTCAP